MKYQAAVQDLKTANHQYSKRQVSWIRNKLLPAIRASNSSEGTEGVDMYLLDATGPYIRLELGPSITESVRTCRASTMDIGSQRRGKPFDGRSVSRLVFINRKS